MSVRGLKYCLDKATNKNSLLTHANVLTGLSLFLYQASQSFIICRVVIATGLSCASAHDDKSQSRRQRLRLALVRVQFSLALARSAKPGLTTPSFIVTMSQD